MFSTILKKLKKIIWPRGYPLDEIKTKKNCSLEKLVNLKPLIQQHLSSTNLMLMLFTGSPISKI